MTLGVTLRFIHSYPLSCAGAVVTTHHFWGRLDACSAQRIRSHIRQRLSSCSRQGGEERGAREDK
jgi:hypothetical protein